MVVPYLDHHLVNELVFRSPFVYQLAIQMPGTKVTGISIANHLNKLKVCYSDVSAIQMFLLFRCFRYSDPHCICNIHQNEKMFCSLKTQVLCQLNKLEEAERIFQEGESMLSEAKFSEELFGLYDFKVR